MIRNGAIGMKFVVSWPKRGVEDRSFKFGLRPNNLKYLPVTAPMACAFANHRRAFLADGDAVAVTKERVAVRIPNKQGYQV